ncbi:O-antigen ligase family protein [Cedecea colo]|uniref:Oligosaccharide repeat unit polymerase n=1 Tax=Cedecea colo TaxID=2552946 RepID=A0ABX0VGB4_9ENTR|nr:O-antigen ligase family protein [Cedecea colo]NIY46205.1 oligosaccharide repeat unit polymerase [Cedecea colo]
MFGILAKYYIFFLLIIYPSLTLLSLFGLIPFYPYNFIVIGLGLCLILGMLLRICTGIRVKIGIIDGLVITAFVWYFSVIILNNNIYSYTEDGRFISSVRYYFPFFIVSFCCYFIFKCGADFFYSTNVKYYLLTIYTVLFFITILYFDPSSFKIDFSYLIDPSFIGVYQIVSDSLAFTVISILALAKLSKLFRIIIIATTLFFLLILNARSGLVGFIFGLCFIFNIRENLIKKPVFIISCILFLFVIIFLIIPDVQIVLAFFENSNSRIYNIFSGNFSDDASFMGRMKLLLHSFSVIFEHPLLGDFGSQASNNIDGFGVRWGAYTHNIFVYWDQFGFIGFMFIMLIIIVSVYNNIKIKRNLNIDLSAVIAFVLSQQLFLKSFTYFYFFAMVGLIEGVKYVSKYNYNHKKL